MRIIDWSSDVCSSDLAEGRDRPVQPVRSRRQGRAYHRRARGHGAVNRIDTRFTELKAANRKALIPFITAGDPSLESLVPVMHALVEAGADVIELGVPFSDPMADGPTLQRSSERALARGPGLSYVFESVRAFRQRDPAPQVVLRGYLNQVRSEERRVGRGG